MIVTGLVGFSGLFNKSFVHQKLTWWEIHKHWTAAEVTPDYITMQSRRKSWWNTETPIYCNICNSMIITDLSTWDFSIIFYSNWCSSDASWSDKMKHSNTLLQTTELTTPQHIHFDDIHRLSKT
jgi:hypothetical protein